ncbi:hypothetical protein SAMN04488136_10911 [Vibrio xiamenensis]|uniref:Uncharacterized protein n=1 Tax=Vibrio xiamenensis TaxID=861298 RepID=A0A1G7ZX36_9VIBR|nr:hypothetical protein [Vibrio xiamenensis]SDH13259.1 hypothetical protein SAMN04488136_10911 [Vibrio xiamenensis]
MIKRKRRWLAWLTLANYMLLIATLCIELHIGAYTGFMLYLALLAYNYFLVRLVIALPKGTLKLRQHSYLIIPLALSVGFSSLFSIAYFWR